MRLTKSKDDVVVSGVLAGIGEYYKIDPTLIRIGVAILLFVGVAPVIPLYIIGAFLIPEAPEEEDKKEPKRKRKTRKSKPVKETKRYDEQPSSRGNMVEEDDWSDF